MIVYDVAAKLLDTGIFLQHTIADLNLWHYIYCFVQSGESSTVKGNTHTHTHTHTHIHTHIHTYTHTLTFIIIKKTNNLNPIFVSLITIQFISYLSLILAITIIPKCVVLISWIQISLSLPM